MNLAQRKVRLLLKLRKAGVIDHEVLAAIERIPRELFVPSPFIDQAYEDQALPIGSGQTISQPQIVALMTQALNIQKHHKILEIGTGSGYQTAVLAQLARRVYTIERHKSLLTQAEQRLVQLRLYNVTSLLGDGSKGWPSQAPFDRIIVTAAAAERPQNLLDQLGKDGILVVPIGDEHGAQELIKIEHGPQAWRETKLTDVRFVPLVSGNDIQRISNGA